jgi:hypothetical protein
VVTTLMRVKTPKLPLTPDERRELRACGLRLADFVGLEAEGLAQRLGWPSLRVLQLCSLAVFQQLPDVGPATAGDLVLLGYHEPANLVGEDAGEMFRRLQVLTHSQQDPCCEDVFNGVIHHATHGTVPERHWWEWSDVRKGRQKP